MNRAPLLLAVLFACAPTALAQVSYCRDIGGGKTYCSGGTVIHHHGRTTIVPNAAPAQPQPMPTLPSPLQQQDGLPTLNAPYSPAGTQGAVPAPVIQPARPDAPGAPVIVVPPAGSRICHQFGTTLVCN